MQELLRPWKLVTLGIGLGLLVAGSFVYEAPDWDISVSVLMALVAYVTAPWCMRVLLERRWRRWPAMLLLTWFGVDGCYTVYWSVMNPMALELMRKANAPASLSLFWTVGLFWMYQGPLKEFSRSVVALSRNREVGRRHCRTRASLRVVASYPGDCGYAYEQNRRVMSELQFDGVPPPLARDQTVRRA